MSKTKQDRKICAGSHCLKYGIYPLTIIYLNRLGWFCKSCKNDLISERLVIECEGTDSHQDAVPAEQSQSLLDVNQHNDHTRAIR